MSDSNKKQILVIIAAGLVFTVGFGIGVQLYATTKEFDFN